MSASPFLRNSPTNFTDPSGLEKVPIRKGIRKGDADIFHRLALLCCSFFGRPRGRQEKCPRPLFFVALLCCSFFGRPRGRQEKCPRPLFFVAEPQAT
jgi:hypothetical protein